MVDVIRRRNRRVGRSAIALAFCLVALGWFQGSARARLSGSRGQNRRTFRRRNSRRCPRIVADWLSRKASRSSSKIIRVRRQHRAEVRYRAAPDDTLHFTPAAACRESKLVSDPRV